jgi:rod shape-determining protein MreD
MNVNGHIIIFLTIFTGFWLDNFISSIDVRVYIPILDGIPYLIETCIGFLIFCYWVYAIPERLQSSSALCYGLLIDLCFSDAIGFHMLFFITTSYVIHVYALRFRLFSYFQLIIFFAGAAIFYLACKYLIFSPGNYSYLLLIFSFFINAMLWLPIYFGMRYLRRTLL